MLLLDCDYSILFQLQHFNLLLEYNTRVSHLSQENNTNEIGGSKFQKSQNIQLMIVEVIKNEEFILEGPNPHNLLCRSCSYCVHGTVM
jgi:hypothetical protein